MGTPWSPHIGLELDIISTPRQVIGPVLCLPAPLPVKDFVSVWLGLSPLEQSQAWQDAQQGARERLLEQRAKTGVAILGRPPEALKQDPKFQGDLLEASKKCGGKIGS